MFSRFQSYSWEQFRGDALAGLVVALVAIPLAIGFAIASGVDPAMGIIAAIVGGFTAGLLGGSEFNISGPTGAMVVVVLGVTAKYGLSGLILATIVAGFILILLGILRLGKVIEYIPSPVIVGFTAGIAAIIFFGQLNNFFGISPTYPAGAEFIEKTIISLQHSFEANWAAVLLAALAVASLLLCRRFFKRIPGHIIAIAITTFLAMFVPYFSTVPQVSDIGIIPSTLPIPHMPEWSFALIKNILPAALTIAALAAIESLLSAVVADGMTDTRHKPNRELVGVGAANIASGAFGGLPITGAIARTATNVRAGGRTRVAAILHAILVLAIVFFAAPLMGSVPLGAIAGILMFTAYNMVEWDRVHRIFRTPLSDVAVMLTTFALTVFVDLTVAIEVGLILAALLFMKRMTDLYQIESLEGTSSLNIALRRFKHKEISIYTIRGPLFFGAANRIDQALGEIPGGHKPYKIIRMVHVPVVDATGLAFLEGTAQKHKRLGGAVYFVGVQPAVLRRMRDAGLLEEIGEDKLFSTTHQALQAVLREIALKTGASIDGSDTQYDLTSLEAEERASVQTLDDKDPIEEILDTVGVSKVAALGSQTMRQTTKFGTRTVKQTAKLGKKLTRAKKKRHL